MRFFVGLLSAAFLAVALAGCGDKGPDDSQFEIGAPDVTVANTVRGALADIEPGADVAVAGQSLVENLEGMIDQPGAESHKETYQKILEAAKKLAEGDASQLKEMKTLAETLPK